MLSKSSLDLTARSTKALCCVLMALAPPRSSTRSVGHLASALAVTVRLSISLLPRPLPARLSTVRPCDWPFLLLICAPRARRHRGDMPC